MVPRALKLIWIVLTAVLVVRDFQRAEVVEVVELELSVSDVDRSIDFFSRVLDFSVVTRDDRHARLMLGDETLLLRERAAIRPQHSNELTFQHIAIVVTDMDAAYARLRAANARITSHGPQLLPESNRDVAGIRAVYFRDPDGNPLELIEFPDDKGESRWHASSPLFAGIDHTAIVVTDTDRALDFYRKTVGLTIAGESLNTGREQAALSGVPGARVRVTALRGARGPGIELLEYEAPELAPPSTGPRAWRIHLAAGADNELCREGITHDNDGHRLTCDRERDRWYAYAWEALRRHWLRYVLEGLQLGVFLVIALYLTIALEHPRSPLRRRLPNPVVRRVLMGIGIGATVVVLLYSSWAMLSGGHFNPAVTLSFLAFDRIQPWDAFFYLPAQLLGGFLGVWLAALPVRKLAAHDKVKLVATEPKPKGERKALIAEVIISFLLLLSLMLVYESDALKHYLPWVAGIYLCLFIVVEAPYSGMSLNPARTLASSLASHSYKSLWLYFVAPIWAMHLAMAVVALVR